MANDWYKQKEKGSFFWVKLTFYLVCFMPRFLLTPIVFFISFLYFLSSKNERKNLERFYLNLNKKFGTNHKNVFRNFFEFSKSIVDKISVWLGKIKYDDLVLENEKELYELFFNAKRGKVIIVSHFGNVEIAKALSRHYKDLKMAVLVYDQNSLNFGKMLNSLNDNHIKIFRVDSLDIGVMLELSKFIDEGGFICTMGDRIPVSGNKICKIPFLGQMAKFPQGGFVLASLLKCEVWTLWCIKKSGKYNIKVDFLAQNVERKNIAKYIQIYLNLLELNCKEYPQMWFNFFDIWSDDENL
ncbi:hypothetical protein [Campylobacter hyointestinalis]|uniref:Glycosyl transferase, group 2 family protein n=2 Tax=Campylobacter hyointestinalis TaxID=198 RepID=A0A0S4RBV6_CAMHY|nr:hypothetical protein [Campylobacter hyointestinalis]MBT0611602.1 hypothetical protein [Campylobacter hyointestinalis subsp. hyointestinalis]MDY2998898.1 hypothetical protein [Campylobacter hyointestinalis]PPB52239.1 hypothetical protein CDQ68_05450 [Campylobacter hyointestinalis subsp. hyointestinalis]PPB54150.1 hypothetical protein CDQ69_04645 [Campylobacter hyointestinalis subsp. hyointestinalis]PPB55760.1 hypothetical protein CDQ67_04180 [Campylobacter hyointestinalis subsp. hyointestina